MTRPAFIPFPRFGLGMPNLGMVVVVVLAGALARARAGGGQPSSLRQPKPVGPQPVTTTHPNQVPGESVGFRPATGINLTAANVSQYQGILLKGQRVLLEG